MSEVPRVQTLEIRDWLPTVNPNGSRARRHWSVMRKFHDIDRDMAWAAARQAGWVFVPGRVRLTITLVFPRKPIPDPDNAVARCKGLIDGLKNRDQRVKTGNQLAPWVGCIQQNFFTDDDSEHLDLRVNAVVEKGIKAVRITLEALDGEV